MANDLTRRAVPRSTTREGVGGEVHVWTAATASLEADGRLAEFAALCSPEEEARRARFVFERDRRAFLAAHGLVRLALSWCEPGVDPAAWEYAEGRHGRPEVAGQPAGRGLRFNLSHSAESVACIVTRGPDCGIDVESVHRSNDHEALAGRMLTADERRELAGAAPEDRPRRFIERWTLKEAYAKALGLGLSLRFEEVGFTGLPEAIRLAGGPAGWRFELWEPDAGHVAALAVREGGEPLRIIRHRGAPAPPPPRGPGAAPRPRPTGRP